MSRLIFIVFTVSTCRYLLNAEEGHIQFQGPKIISPWKILIVEIHAVIPDYIYIAEIGLNTYQVKCF